MPATTPPAGSGWPDDQSPSPSAGAETGAGAESGNKTGTDTGAESGTDPGAPAGSGTGTGRGQDQLRAELRSLRRARDGRLLAGVCAGLGPRLQIDPVVLRVVGVILALFGGVGVLLYAAGWLLVPDDGEDLSILEQQLGRRRNGAPDNAIVVGGLVILGLVIFSVPWWGFPWHVPVLLVLSVLGLYALIRRNAEQDGGGAAPSDRPGEPGGSGGTFPPGTAAGAGTSGASGGTGDITSPPAATEPARSTWDHTKPLDVADPGSSVPTSAADAPPGSWRTAEPAPASFWNQPDPLGLEIQDVELAQPPENWTPPPATPPRQVRSTAVRSDGERKRSWLLAGTMAAALLLVMVLALADQQEDVPLGAYIAGPLGVVGLGLILGAWFGRTRALIASGVVLALALPAASLADRWPGEAVDLTLHPTSVSAIQGSYEYGVGELVIDLSAVPFRDGQHVESSIDVGVGDVLVVVPPDVDVIFKGDVGLGEISLFGRALPPEPVAPRPPRAPAAPGERDAVGELGDAAEGGTREFDAGSSEGFGVSREIIDRGDDGPGGGELVLNIDVGVGHVGVHRGE
ncbi:PspC domain-containing protein [Actinopolymorpha sp. B9G3]|uniref:PspC domain-containing protein n=1 Tax=Actinopolymorpha sp. B9G3 TaxID=3158970 RepID=UPI0032D95350